MRLRCRGFVAEVVIVVEIISLLAACEFLTTRSRAVSSLPPFCPLSPSPLCSSRSFQKLLRTSLEVPKLLSPNPKVGNFRALLLAVRHLTFFANEENKHDETRLLLFFFPRAPEKMAPGIGAVS
jgi:hypothetical protein